MKIADVLTNQQKQQLQKIKSPKKKHKELHKPKQEKKKEKLSEFDLIDLMGSNRPTYVRKGGAIRRK
jgi:hypothetical protein